jgi:hypothetical protein
VINIVYENSYVSSGIFYYRTHEDESRKYSKLVQIWEGAESFRNIIEAVFLLCTS